MPQNKRESLIYTVMMCFVMVLWMSIYNVALQYGTLNLEVIVAAWIGFPIAYIFGMCCDWFVASSIAKGVAFRYLISPQDPPLKKILCISGGMVVCMVIIMSLYGACEGAFHTGDWSGIPVAWLWNIPRNFVMALPVQFLVAGPLIRRVFRAVFPEGTVLA
ncbi:DUF2798 domain-containing protein [uncultured Oscillibacter sp.]|uniref:DUF2798 domain-containing protein n=1 Tax=uncultured Oscillibacter sp. TaxID=876091 RepID=UPI00280C169F|nr:DUF2798 domain-containing protein [uncultured Oscillibacter sp.]